VVGRHNRTPSDLVDQLFNSTERRLARTLLLLARFGKEGRSDPLIPGVSQQTLAEMIGTTRSHVSVFLNRFRKLGFIEYNGGLQVHRSLVSVVLHEELSIGILEGVVINLRYYRPYKNATISGGVPF
jgi:CRP/FNR family cyclic AMP-dependent transcriptional regulator